jgi:DeoR/GlpR family transcriptional regulator of sugar metabolism
VTVGSETVDALRRVRVDACVLGICSVHPEIGITALDHDEAQVKRAMVEASAEVIALATADKLQTASPWVVAPVSELTHLVTDAGDDVTAAYADAGVSVIRA